MSVIKPSLKYATFNHLREKLILDGNEERILLLSSNEGFEFYDDDERQGDYHCFLSIINEGENPIRPVCISVTSTLKTTSDAKMSDNFECIVKQLRRNEGIILRIHNTEQRKKYYECFEKKETIETEFNCTINYLTLAKQQICYEYSIKVSDIPKTDEHGNTRYSRKTEIIKDEYEPVNDISINVNAAGSPFRDLQENLMADGFGYKYRRIGDEQMTGTLKALKRFFEEQGITEAVKQATDSVSNIDKSMQNMSQTFTYLETLTKLNRDIPAQIETTDAEVINTDEI